MRLNFPIPVRSVLFLSGMLMQAFSACFCANGQSAFDTTGGRYLNPVFDSVLVSPDIFYSAGRNAAGQIQDLYLNVYQPFGDTLAQRPVLILIHGGSFVQGSRTDMHASCIAFAKRGYTTATIQYRLGFSSFTAPAVVEATIRATQDAKNAVRFLRNTTISGNPYHIHPDFIFVGGVSAGAITTLQAAYLDQLPEIPVGQSIPTIDSLDNASQNPGNWRFKAAINIAGAVGDTNWMQPGDVPVMSFHGTADATVPYISGTLGGALPLFGSFSVFQRATHIGIRAGLRAFPGGGHDYTVGNPEATDTTERRICLFLIPFLLENMTGIVVKNTAFRPIIYKYGDDWMVQLPECEGSATLLDLAGRVIQQKKFAPGQKVLSVGSVSFGRMVRLETTACGQSAVFLPGGF